MPLAWGLPKKVRIFTSMALRTPKSRLQAPATNTPDRNKNLAPIRGRILPKTGAERNTTTAYALKTKPETAWLIPFVCASFGKNGAIIDIEQKVIKSTSASDASVRR